MSDATRPSSPVTPTIRGLTRRAATISSGSSACTTARANEPSTSPSTARVASARPRPAAMRASIRWTRTSVSVSETKACPAATSSARSGAWFSMIPLWIRAIRPEQSRWGWALLSSGRPWVAHRVWPIPAKVRGGAFPTAPTSSASLPARFSTQRPVWPVPDPSRSDWRSVWRATPAES